MKLIIAGGRDYYLAPEDFKALDVLHDLIPVTEEVCGGATGADSGGKLWAIQRGIPVKDFPADWKRHGKKAGPLRNGEMARYADAVALFPGGRGTENMFAQAVDAGLRIFDFRTRHYGLS